MAGKQFNRNSNGGGFKVIARLGEDIPTRKDNENIRVQLVEAGGRKWVEARLQYKDPANPGRWVATKQAIGFNNVDDLATLGAVLTASAASAEVLAHLTPPPPADDEAPQDDDPPVIPLVVPPRAAAFASDD